MKTLFLSILCLAGVCNAHASGDVVFRFAYEDKAVFPFFAGDSTEIPPKPGVTVEIVQQLGKTLPNFKVELQRMPWKRCLILLKAGDVDAVVASFNPERMESGVYPMKQGQPDPTYRIGNTNYSLYKLKGSALDWDGKNLLQLSGSIGVPRGYSIGTDLAAKGATVEESNSTSSDLEKLLRNRLTGVAALEPVGDYYTKQAKFSEITKVKTPLAVKDYYLILSHQFVKKNPELAEKIWQRIAATPDGPIFAKYLD